MASVAKSQRQVLTQSRSFGGVSTQAPTSPGMGPALAQAGQVINKIGALGQKWQDEADATELSAFQTRLRNKQNEAIHNKDNGFSTIRGKNTAEAYGQYKDDYDKYVSDEVGGLSERLRSKAGLIGEKYKVDIDNQLNSHTGREMEAHADGVFKSSVQSLKDHAVLNAYETKGRIGSVIAEQKALIEGYAARKGLSPEQVKAASVDAASDIHKGVIQQFLNQGDDLLAKDYLNAATKRGEISGDDAPGITRMLRASSIKGESQRIVGDVSEETYKTGAKAGEPLNYKDSIEAIKNDPKSKDPEIKDAAVERFKLGFQEEKVDKTFAENKYFQDLGDEMMKSPETFELKTTDYDKMSFSQAKQLMAAKSQILNESRGGKDSIDWKEYDRLISLTPQELAKERIYDNKGLNNAKKNELLNLKKDNKKHVAVQSLNGFVSKMVDSEDADEQQFIRTMFENQLNAYPKDQQQKLETWQKIQDTIFLDMDKKWSPFDTPLWEVRMKGFKGSLPSSRPRNIPDDAVFIDKVIQGRRVTGYQQGSGAGSKIYDIKGNHAFNLDAKK